MRTVVSMTVNALMRRMYALFLRPLDVQQHAIQPEHALLQRVRLLRDLAWLRWWLSSRLALDHDVKVEELLGERGHVILEAEGVFADGVGGHDVVALSFADAIEENLVIGVFHFKVDVKGASRLNLEEVETCV